MNKPDMSCAQWRKSSRSSANGQCVEVTVLTDADWRKSRRSSGSGACVEAASLGRALAVRDSKDPDGANLFVSPAAWRKFTRVIKNGTAA
ncbi:MAG TPA: DUF397 domain-containing protein [Streptosporangiaceae bacterium]|jgi:hypothetical protein